MQLNKTVNYISQSQHIEDQQKKSPLQVCEENKQNEWEETVKLLQQANTKPVSLTFQVKALKLLVTRWCILSHLLTFHFSTESLMF